jgi:hypothetical protein
MSSFIKDAEVGVINENAVAALTGEFAGNAHGNKVLHGFTGCREAHLVLAAEVAEIQDGAFAQGGKDAESVGSGAFTLCCAAGVRLEEIHEPAGGLNSAVGGGFHAFQKKVHPGFPVSRGSDAVEQIVIHGAVFFEEEGEIEQGLREKAAMVEQQGNEQAAEATIAVEKRMDGLELHMGQSGFE